MKKKIVCTLLMTLIMALCGCGTSKIEEPDSISIEEKAPEFITGVSSTVPELSADECNQILLDTYGIPNIEVEFGSYIYSIPGEYEFENQDEDGLHYTMGDDLKLDFIVTSKACTDEEFNLYAAVIAYSLSSQADVQTADTKVVDNAAFTMSYKSDGLHSKVILINDKSSDRVDMITLECRNRDKDIYVDDFDTVIASVKAKETASAATTDTSATASESTSASSSLVTPELKEFLDSYEAFIDEYIEFMQNYSESDDVLSMLTDYADYMQRYADVTAKAEKYDPNTMNEIDSLYYTEVMLRVSNKLMKVAYK